MLGHSGESAVGCGVGDATRRTGPGTKRPPRPDGWSLRCSGGGSVRNQPDVKSRVDLRKRALGSGGWPDAGGRYTLKFCWGWPFRRGGITGPAAPAHVCRLPLGRPAGQQSRCGRPRGRYRRPTQARRAPADVTCSSCLCRAVVAHPDAFQARATSAPLLDCRCSARTRAAAGRWPHFGGWSGAQERPRARTVQPASRHMTALRVPRPSMTRGLAAREASRCGSTWVNCGHSVRCSSSRCPGRRRSGRQCSRVRGGSCGRCRGPGGR